MNNNGFNNMVLSFSDFLSDNCKSELLIGDISKILIAILSDNMLLTKIGEMFYSFYDFIQFFIFYFSHILSEDGFSLNLILDMFENGENIDYSGKYKFDKELDLSPSYFRGVNTLPSEVFSDWKGLKSVHLSNDVKAISDYAFYNSSIENIIIPNSVTIIGEEAFSHCQNLKEVIIPNSVTKMGYGVFSECERLERVVIPGKVKIIAREAFRYCSNLKDVVILKGVKEVSASAFGDCQSLQNIVLPDGLKKIGASAFEYCENLTNITIPDSVIRIDSSAFFYCHSIKSLQLPNKLEKLGWSVFGGCVYTLNDVTYNGTKNQWEQIEKARSWYSNWAWKDKPKEIKCTDGVVEVKG